MTGMHIEEVRRRMHSLYVPLTDRGTSSSFVNLHAWWRDPEVLGGVGELLAHPFQEAKVTVVVGPPASGYLLGPLVARHLGVGFGIVRKDPSSAVDSDPWFTATTAPDYQDRHVKLGIRQGILRQAGSQLLAIKKIVEAAGASWVGSSVAIDLLTDSAARRRLGLHSIFNRRDLP
jgi:adenine phosphoribosyltransferase